MTDLKIFKCVCESPEHMFYVEKYPCGEDVPEIPISIHIHLDDIGFWYRLKYAFKYLFKIGNNSAFDSVMLSPEQVSQLSSFLTHDSTKSKHS